CFSNVMRVISVEAVAKQMQSPQRKSVRQKTLFSATPERIIEAKPKITTPQTKRLAQCPLHGIRFIL
ncbi:MAG: hypothetical protein C5B55_04405, partial [Blastocatellia bacterium]